MSERQLVSVGAQEMVAAGHLGGYFVGGDPATQYPALWEWLVRVLGIRSVIDVGCGDGQAVRFFREQGCAVLGIDGVEQEDESIITHDFTAAPWPLDDDFELCDMIWCCEFVEHVEERFVPNFLAAFQLAKKYVILTHAFPGQDGYHHVNCQDPSYWKGVMAAIGFSWRGDLTAVTRGVSALNRHPLNHYLRSGLVFKRS